MGLVIKSDSAEIDKFLADLTDPVRQKFFETSDMQTTVREMRKLILKGIADVRANMLATMLTRDLPGRDFDKIAGRMYRWITHKVKYTRDPSIAEWLQDWEVTLKRRAGDCDDFTIISGTLLGTLGISTRIKVVQAGKPEWNHVYLEYYSPAQKKWIAFDASQNKDVGWEPATIYKAQITKI